MNANPKFLAAAASLAACFGAQTGHAGPVGPLTTFTAGTTAKASEVNGNFGAVQTAVDDNDSRVATLEGINAATRLGALESINAASRLAALEASVASLQTALTTAQNQIGALQTLLAGVTRETVNGQPAVRFSGVNVQIVSGAGATDAAPNGTGNLIIGYDEVRTVGPQQCSVGADPGTSVPVPDGDAAACAAAGGALAISHKTGSHYLVVGDLQNYSQYAGIVVGKSNTSSNAYASVSGGTGNTAKGLQASVSGGISNTASGYLSSVSGGTENIASGESASVSGGFVNVASGDRASVSGGEENTASGGESSVSGGSQNIASSLSSSVSGGFTNTASGIQASVSGGTGNTADGQEASVSGGQGCATGAVLNKWVVGLQASAGCSALAN